MYQLNNLFYGELDLSGGDIGSAATTITLSTGDVANLEITPTATDPALFTIWDKSYEHAGAARRDGGKVEMIEVTGKDQANDTLTAGTRGFSNTTAQSYNSADNTTYGIVQVSADELFDSLLIAGASNKIQDRSGTTLDTINAATMLQIAGTDIEDADAWTPVLTDANSGGNNASFTGGGRYVRLQAGVYYVSFFCTSIDTTGMTGTNALQIQGLPATIAGSTSGGYAFEGAVHYQNVTVTNNLVTRAVGGQSKAFIYDGGTLMTVDQITSTTGRLASSFFIFT